MRTKLSFIAFYTCVAAISQNVQLDSGFGLNGKVIASVATIENFAQDMALQPDGKFVAVGSAQINDYYTRFAVARFNVDGSFDFDFGSQGKVLLDIYSRNYGASSVAIQPDGKILVAGAASELINNEFGHTDFALTRLNSDGTVDTAFGTNGLVTTDFHQSDDRAESVKIQVDGKIVVVGQSGSGELYQYENFAIVRYNVDGSLDDAFGSTGKVEINFGDNSGSGFGSIDIARDFVILPDEKLIVAGASDDGDLIEKLHPALVKLYSDGSIDTSFGIDGKYVAATGFNDGFNSLILTSNNDVVAAGGAAIAEGVFMTMVARFSTNGAIDETFGSDGITTVQINPDIGFDFLNDVLEQPDGKFLATGITLIGSGSDVCTLRYNTDGTLDETFGNQGILLTSFDHDYAIGNAIIWQPDGKFIVGGGSVTADSGAFAFARYLDSDLANVNNQIIDFKVSPNPFNSYVDVTLAEDMANMAVQIFDLSGRSIMKESTIDILSGTPARIRMPHNLPHGVYILKLSNGSVSHSIKLSK